MAETVLIRGEGGCELAHDLPLPDALAARVAAGEALNLGPCDGDGNLITPEPEPEPEPAPVEVPVVKRPVGRPPASSRE